MVAVAYGSGRLRELLLQSLSQIERGFHRGGRNLNAKSFAFRMLISYISMASLTSHVTGIYFNVLCGFKSFLRISFRQVCVLV